MKPFHHWVADMADSIEDSNEYMNRAINKTGGENINPGVQQAPTSMTEYQVRALLANSLAGIPNDEETVEDWMQVFCVGYSKVAKTLFDHNYAVIIGKKEKDIFVRTDGGVETLKWWEEFYERVMDGTFQPEEE